MDPNTYVRTYCQSQVNADGLKHMVEDRLPQPGIGRHIKSQVLGQTTSASFGPSDANRQTDRQVTYLNTSGMTDYLSYAILCWLVETQVWGQTSSSMNRLSNLNMCMRTNKTNGLWPNFYLPFSHKLVFMFSLFYLERQHNNWRIYSRQIC